ncbi:MAG: hypothetical protein ABIF09_08075 [Gemmatimonadota bacterium]
MRTVYVLPLLALALGCGDGTLLQPDSDGSLIPGQPELTVAAAQGDVKMVPFKGSGHWWGVAAETPEREGFDCEAMGGLFLDEGAGVINVTHLGRSEYGYVNCWGEVDILYQFGWVKAANGDQVTWHGTVGEGLVTIADWDNGTYEMRPLLIDGGTGRFEGATGIFHSSGTFEVVDGAYVGTETWKGIMSSVGSMK